MAFGAIVKLTYLKKSSLQNNKPFRAKHFSFNWTWHSLHCRHFACHVRSSTFNMKRSKISSWHPPHFGIVAATVNKLKAHLDFAGRTTDEIEMHMFFVHSPIEVRRRQFFKPSPAWKFARWFLLLPVSNEWLSRKQQAVKFTMRYLRDLKSKFTMRILRPCLFLVHVFGISIVK